MAEIVQEPELRYTSDTQTPITEMLVQFEGLRPEDPLSVIKVVGWGNLAQEIQEQFHKGDRVVIEGRLGMNTFDRPEGFKEKRAELTAQRIHSVAIGASTQPIFKESTGSYNSASSPASQAVESSTRVPASTPAKATKAKVSTPPPVSDADYDDIPF
jgi:single-strand DNA-binding protein